MTAGFDAALTMEASLADGTCLQLRPITSGDKQALAGLVDRMSIESRSLRFLGAMHHLSPRMLRYLTEVDYINHFALVVSTCEEPADIVGVGRYIRLKERPVAAEMAAAVADAEQGRGIGRLILDALVAVAQEAGISTFVASVRQDNAAMRAMFPVPVAHSTPDGSGVLSYEMDLAGRAATLQGRPLYRRYRAAARAVVAECAAGVEQTG